MKQVNMAIVGSTGTVGREMISILEQRKFNIHELFLYASKKSEGELISFNKKKIRVEALTETSFEKNKADIALFSAGGEISKKFAPLASKSKCVVVDNTNAFRMDPEVPLVVPEVNADAISSYKKKRIIANPNCSTIQMVVALKPIHDKFKIKRIVVSTYQSVSGKGKKGIDELSSQTIGLLNQRDIVAVAFPHQIAFNCIPHIDVPGEEGYYLEELKMINETKKIFNDPSLGVTATTVRVPVFSCHAEAVNIETEKSIKAEEVRKLLSDSPGVKVLDEPNKNQYPTHIECTGKDEVYVGRIRQDLSIKNGINLWIVSDNVRKGAALNAIQISEILVEKYLFLN